jgi:hypothetical protein
MIKRIFRTATPIANLMCSVCALAVALFLICAVVAPSRTSAAVAWALSRAGATVGIDSAGQINLTPASGKTTVVTRPIALNGGATVPTAKTIAVTDADAVTVGGVIVPQAIEVTYRCGAAGTCVTSSFFIANAAYQVTAVNAVWGTAESTATNLRIQVEKLTGTTAAGSGTALLTNNSNAGISIKGTANTVGAGTLTATGASLQMAPGDRLGIKYETAPTEGASVVVTVTLKRI